MTKANYARTAADTNTSLAIDPATTSPELAKAQSIAIPDNATFSRCGSLRFALETQFGTLEIEAGRCDSLFIRGTPEAIIGFGLVMPEWIPGRSTTNATAQRVIFELDGPLLPLGKPKGRRPSAPRIIVRAWGTNRRAIDVQIALTNEQKDQCETVSKLLQSSAEKFESDCETARKREYRREGNVIFLLHSEVSPVGREIEATTWDRRLYRLECESA
jgi:hypothetical protein